MDPSRPPPHTPHPSGHPGQPGYAAPTFPICGHCGVAALREATTCAVCDRPLAQVRTEAPMNECWVALRTRFKCRGCGFEAPLDQLDVDGAVECAHCGLRQAFNASSWRRALDFAHGVADLAGPMPEGRVANPFVWIGDSNPYATVGVTQVYRDTEVNYDSDGRELFVQAGPGFPSCKKCLVAFLVRVDGNVAHTECPRCHDRAVYELPKGAQNVVPGVVAIVADELRTDRKRANVGGDANVVALACPGCGAPLKLEGESRAFTCPFCRTLSFVPGRVMARALGRAPKPETWWILFRGPSTMRKGLEAPNGGEASVAKAMKKLLRGKKGKRMTPEEAMAMLQQKGTEVTGRGIEEAPEMTGVNWPQIVMSLALICLFLGLADLIFE